MCGMDHNDGRVILSFTMDHYTTCGMGCVLLPVIWVIKCCFISMYLFFFNCLQQDLSEFKQIASPNLWLWLIFFPNFTAF